MRQVIAMLGLFFFCFSSTAQESAFPYSRSKKDFLIAPISLSALIVSEIIDKRDYNLTIDEIEKLDRASINSFDRSATYNWSESAEKFSDIPEQILRFSPLLQFIPLVKHKKWDHAGTYGLMYAEVLMLNTGLTGITKSLAGRIRPYLYNTSLTAEERFAMQSDEAPVASTSFFSGHSSTAFASAVFLSKTYTDIYGRNTWSKVIWAGSLTLATVTAVARVEAGVHFPTDVLVGALVGSAIGYLIPVLHKTKTEKLSFSVFPNYMRIGYSL